MLIYCKNARLTYLPEVPRVEEPLMSAYAIAPISPDPTPARHDRRSWLFAIGGMLAGCCTMMAVYIVTVAPPGLLIGMAWQHAASAQKAYAFDSRTLLASAQVLRGVNGEARASDAPDLATTELSSARILSDSEITPAAWDRLSSGACIALTTVSGQKLSFRIVGAKENGTQRKQAGSASIDLVVAPCSPNDEAILKAVIESKTDRKENAVQRNL